MAAVSLMIFCSAAVVLSHGMVLNVHSAFQKDGLCGEKVSVYHLDSMSAYGFGCQYNHLIQFLAISVLEERKPVLVGPWTLGCPVGNSTDAAEVNNVLASKHMGFDPCYLSFAHQAECTDAAGDSEYAKAWQRSFDFRNGNKLDEKADFDWRAYAHGMLEDRAVPEWHFDGDVVCWLNSVDLDCGSGEASFGTGWAAPPAASTAITEACDATGVAQMSRLHVYRYIAQHYAPFSGEAQNAMEAARDKCRSWLEHGAGGKLLAIHVRRTDKVIHEDRAYGVEEYLKAARGWNWDFGGVFVATDDPVAVDAEMKKQDVSYYMLKDRPEGWDQRGSTVSTLQFLAEVSCLADADYFVGTAGSNVARMVQVLRSRDEGTAINIDGKPLPVGA